MRKALLALLVACAATPALAEPTASYFLARGTLATLNHVGQAATEVNLWVFDGEVLANGEPGEEPEEEEFGGCVEIFRDNVSEVGCGPIVLAAQPLLSGADISGTVATTISDYVNDPEMGPTWTYRGDGEITLDISLSATAPPELRHSEATGPGTCGLPPDISGVLVLLEVPLERTMSATGSISSGELGILDAGSLAATLLETTVARAGACL